MNFLFSDFFRFPNQSTEQAKILFIKAIFFFQVARLVRSRDTRRYEERRSLKRMANNNNPFHIIQNDDNKPCENNGNCRLGHPRLHAAVQ